MTQNCAVPETRRDDPATLLCPAARLSRLLRLETPGLQVERYSRGRQLAQVVYSNGPMVLESVPPAGDEPSGSFVLAMLHRPAVDKS